MALLLIVPAGGLFYLYSINSQASISASQVNKIGNELMDNAELMFSIGDNSWNTLEMEMPRQITKIEVENYNDDINELVIHYEGKHAPSEAVFFTRVDLTNDADVACAVGVKCDLLVHPGNNKIRIESKGSFVKLIVLT